MLGKGEEMAYREEVGTFAGAFCVVTSDGFCEWGAPGAGVVASSGVLDFDDFCSVFFEKKTSATIETHCLTS